MTDLSIIIVTFNTRELLRNCLLSIRNTVREISREVIVVDNGSLDATATMVMSEFPEAILIANPENRGFAAANNQAIKTMRGRYALLLNSDTVLTEGAASELFHFMEEHDKAGMACGQLLNADGTKQNSIANFPTILSLMTNTTLLEYLFPAKYPSKRYFHENPIEVDSGIGACLIVRKESINKVGMLDERYFFFFEETDWAMRMKKAGWKIYFVPAARIFHLQGASIGYGFSSRAAFYRARYQYFKKWDRFSKYVLLVLVVFLRLVVNWIFALTATALTLGLNKKISKRFRLYSQLLLWHLSGFSDGANSEK